MNNLFLIFFNIICMLYFSRLRPQLHKFWSPAAEIEGTLLNNKPALVPSLLHYKGCPLAGDVQLLKLRCTVEWSTCCTLLYSTCCTLLYTTCCTLLYTTCCTLLHTNKWFDGCNSW